MFILRAVKGKTRWDRILSVGMRNICGTDVTDWTMERSRFDVITQGWVITD